MASTHAHFTYRQALPEDLLGIGQVYLRAFPEIRRDLHSPNLSARAAADVIRPCWLAEPAALFVAERPEPDRREIVGYVIAPAHTSRIGRASLQHGLPLLWLGRWVTGQYGLSWRGARALLGDKLHFRKAARWPGAECEARILSLAVDPAWQKRGVGRRLLGMALARLHALGCGCVRLEVRPDHHPARRLYERFGFRRVGQFRDSRGPWEIMILQW